MALSELRIDPQLARQALKVTDTRSADAAGHYELLLPKRLRPVDVPAKTPSNQESPVRVAIFQTPEEPLAELEITGLFLRREVAPADVLEGLLDPAAKVVESRRVPSKGGDLLDVLTRQGSGDDAYYARWWTVKDGGAEGGRLYVLEARALVAHYPQVADELATALASFRLLNPTPWSYYERLQQLRHQTPNDVLCFYPESWELREVSDGTDGPYVANLWQAFGGRLVGRLCIASEEGEDDPEAVTERMTESLGEPVSWAPVEEAEPFAGLERGWLRRGRTSQKSAAADVRIHGAQGRGMTIALSLTGVAARVDALAWSTLRRAQDIVRETFRVAGQGATAVESGEQ